MLLQMLAPMALLTGCAGASFDGACPALVEYPRAIQAQAAEEMAALPPDAALRRLIEDYGAMRAEVRACRD